MKIYIAACGEGWGHTSRALGLAVGLIKEGHNVTIGCYGSGLWRLRKLKELNNYNYRTREIVPEVIINGRDGKFDFWRSALASLLQLPRALKAVFDERRYIEDGSFDAVVSDSRIASMLAGVLAGKPTIYVGNITSFVVKGTNGEKTDKNWIGEAGRLKKIREKSKALGYYLADLLTSHFYTYPDAIVIGDFAPPNTICAPLLSRKRKIKRLTHFVGPISLLCVERPIPTPWNANGRKKILVTIGGLAIKQGFHERLLKVFQGRDDIDVIYPSLFFRKAKRIGNVTVMPQLPSVLHYIAAADMCIIPGGHASPIETILLEKPSIVIPAKEMPEQISHAQMYERLGFGRCVLAEEIHQLPDVIDELIEGYDACRKRCAELSARALNEENGVYNTIKLIESFVKFYW